MSNRIQLRPYRQVADSTDFLLVRAKLLSQEGTPEEAIVVFDTQLKDKKYLSEPAARYGLARADLRAKNLAAAEAQVAELRRLKVASPMLETLAAELRSRQGDVAGATKILRDAANRYPQDRAVAYGLVDALLTIQRADDAQKFATADLQGHTTDFRMRALQAKAYAMQGKRLRQHWAQGEAYALQGQLLAAIEQLQLAQKSPDGDFYERSEVDARLRELKAQQMEEAKLKAKSQ
jgi:predicted Zn-dependent protease